MKLLKRVYTDAPFMAFAMREFLSQSLVAFISLQT